MPLALRHPGPWPSAQTFAAQAAGPGQALPLLSWFWQVPGLPGAPRSRAPTPRRLSPRVCAHVCPLLVLSPRRTSLTHGHKQEFFQKIPQLLLATRVTCSLKAEAARTFLDSTTQVDEPRAAGRHSAGQTLQDKGTQGVRPRTCGLQGRCLHTGNLETRQRRALSEAVLNTCRLSILLRAGLRLNWRSLLHV